MNLANITFILGVWSAVAMVAAIAIGTMISTKGDSFGEPSEIDRRVHRAA